MEMRVFACHEHTDAASAARTLAVQALALSTRSALAGACSGRGLLVHERAHTLGARSACVQPQAAGELRDQQGRGGACPYLPARHGGRVGRDGCTVGGGAVGA